jgi:hypothetical protein
MIDPWNITVVQPAVKPVFKGSAPLRRDALRENLERASKHVLTAGKWTRSKVVVFPEFLLHGFQPGRSNDDWIEASIRVPGPLLEHRDRDRPGQRGRAHLPLRSPGTGVAENRKVEAEVIAGMTRRGVLIAPSGSEAPGAGRLPQQE